MKRACASLLLLGSMLLSGCENSQTAVVGNDQQALASSRPVPVERWYDQAQANRGNVLFQANCAVCHQTDASGTADWKTPNPDGKYPPPPLNGTAHTWHHPLPVLRRTVAKGGVRLGGTMPGFSDKLSATQIDDVLAWVQSNWSDEIYRVWHERSFRSAGAR